MECRGNAAQYPRTLFVANHVSYLDIILLGSIADATFIAKSEIEKWPFIGHLGRSVGTVFVQRYWRRAGYQFETLRERLSNAESFVLFGEGTSSNGLQVLPFKSSLLGVAEAWQLPQPIAVQSVTLIYESLKDGTPIAESNADLYAWYGAQPLMPHLFRALGMQGAKVTVVFGSVIYSWDCNDRKRLASLLRDEISRELAQRVRKPVIRWSTDKPRRSLSKRYLRRKKKEAA